MDREDAGEGSGSMICQECKNRGLHSKVSLVAEVPAYATDEDRFWDEDGRSHIHNETTWGKHLVCSNGHSWYHKERAKCPVANCDWNKEVA